MDKVSIVIPAFGQINPSSLFLSILGSQKQSLPTEVLVVEEYFDKPRYRIVAEQLSAKYISYRIQDHFNIGRARNHGISKSTGKYLLMHDADIVFSNSLFIEKAIDQLVSKENQFLASPVLQHIQKKEIDLWKENAEHNNDPFRFIENCLVYDDFILTTLPLDENDFVVTSHPYDDSKIDRRYVALKNLFESYILKPALFKGKEPLVFKPCVAKGFIFCLKKQAQTVGLYCEDFFQWGGEDGDFKWKLSNLFESRAIPELTEVHLYHDRPYFTPKIYGRNKMISRTRQSNGFMQALEKDKSNAEVYL